MRGKKILFSILLLCAWNVKAQEKPTYKSLFWEISGNGLKKPSYLYGTMHVSDRVAFHLSDSFFIALKNVDVVALESNPETWMTEMYDVETSFDPGAMGMGMLGDLLGMYGFDASAFNLSEPTNDNFAAAMRYKPQPANHILYRGTAFNENFEEDTYLDMFIYQCGKKLKKEVINLEDYEKTMELLFKASMPYDPEATEEDEKEDEEEVLSYYDFEGKSREDIIIEAYRKGDLDLLDSIQRKSTGRKHYYKYFIEERNEIMAHNMDSVFRLGKTLFTGVGAAHLPADRGIINLLRKKGYTVRPVGFSARKDSKLKASIEKLKYPVTFSKVISKDSLFSVDMPGEMHEISSYQEGSREYFYPDVANGCYYSVKRFTTYAPFFGKDIDAYTEKLDSLFFENIPGKTLKKTFEKTPEGYPSWSITNRTRRGDLQVSRVIVTPLNVYFFRVSGTGDYAKGKEAERFLTSIKILESNTGRSVHHPTRNFHVTLPGIVIKEDDNRYYSFNDFNGISYNFRYFESADLSYIEEDTFELNILAENYMYGDDYRIRSRKLTSQNGTHSIEATHLDKKGKKLYSKTVIAGKDYYHLSCDCKTDAEARSYFSSFRIDPYIYKNPFISHTDTSMRFTVTIEKPDTSNSDKMKKLTSRFFGMGMDLYGGFGGKKKKNKEDLSYLAKHKFTSFRSPSTGESVSVFYEKLHNYTMYKDAKEYWEKAFKENKSKKESYIYSRKKMYMQGNDAVYEFVLSDTGSTRGMMAKSVLHGGVQYSVIAFYDTLRGPGKFIQTVFNTFKPDDTLEGMSPLMDKTAMFTDNVTSGDTSKMKQALASYSYVWEDLSKDQVKRIADFMSGAGYTKLKDELKLSYIQMAGYLEKDELIAPLRKIYENASDTMYVQLAVLRSLLEIQTVASVKAFADVLSNDPPLSDNAYELNFINSLTDSVEIAHHAFPQLYSLLEYPEYRENIYGIMAELAERGFLKPEDYKTQVNRISRDASNELKRQLSDEQPDVDAYEATENEYDYDYYGYRNNDKSSSISKDSRKHHLFSENVGLTDKLFLLAPSYTTDGQIKTLFQKVMKSKDNTLRMQTCLVMLKYNIPVDDTTWNYFMKNDKTRYETFRALSKINKKVTYDVAYADTARLALSMLTMGWNRTKTDSAKLYRTYDLNLKGVSKGRLYVFENERKEEWSKAKRKELLYVLIDRGEKDPADFDALVSDDMNVPKSRKSEEVLEDLLRDIRVYNHRRVRAGYYRKYKGYEGFGLGDF